MGIVTAGVGNGNMTDEALEALALAAAKGVVCVRSSRVPTGFVGRNVEIDDDTIGFVARSSTTLRGLGSSSGSRCSRLRTPRRSRATSPGTGPKYS